VAGIDVVEGTVAGLAYFRIGQGPPVAVFPGLGPYNEPPRSFGRRVEIGSLKGLARHFTVYSIYRRVGLPAGVTVEAIAADCVAALRALFRGPVDIVGISTGGNSALQVALDYPDVVRRLVLISSGSRLSEHSRAVCERACVLAEHGKVRASQAALAPAAFMPGVVSTLVGWITWLIVGAFLPKDWDCHDMVRTMRADNAFDVTDRLPAIKARTLIVNGRRDPSYPPELSRLLADGIPHSKLLLYPGSHGGVLMNRRLWPDVTGFLEAM
jgi:pimeloyl-ACP methyl ester carboxylesterase